MEMAPPFQFQTSSLSPHGASPSPILLTQRLRPGPLSSEIRTPTLTAPRKHNHQHTHKLCLAVAPGADPTDTNAQPPIQDQQLPSDVKESVAVLKEAAKTRRVPASDVLAALSKIIKSKVDPTSFFQTLGGTQSPGRTWMLIFTAEGRMDKGRYFPLTAVQRFDAVGKRIENGVYLGPVGNLTFEGRLSWKNKILAFIFECVRVKIGPFGPLQIDFGNQDQREPGTKDPFFIWFYVDEEIAVAQGRGSGVAFWCRCRQVT